MSHDDIYEHKIKIGEIKTKMCRLKMLDCLSQWECIGLPATHIVTHSLQCPMSPRNDQRDQKERIVFHMDDIQIIQHFLFSLK